MVIPKAEFGRTGHKSTRVVFGAAALGHVTQQVADETLEVLLRHGVNHIDTAASYGDSELRIAPWLKQHPDRFFIATKGDKRDERGAREEILRSLDRLDVDHVDLWQIHSLADPIEWDQALSPGGALDAALLAREEGLIKWIGVTGHGAQIAATLRRSLERFDFDSVLLPYSYVMMQDAHYAGMFERVSATCRERNVAVQTIKSVARRPWWGHERQRATWYQPLEDQRDIDLAVHWVLSRPGIFLNTVGDIALLPKVLDAASRFTSAPDAEAMRDAAQRLKMLPLFV